MKKLGLFILALLLGLVVQVQYEILFNNVCVVGGFGVLIIEMGLGNDMMIVVGGGGGVVIDNFFIGGYGVGSIDFECLIEDDDIQEIEFGYGGFWLGYILVFYCVLYFYISV